METYQVIFNPRSAGGKTKRRERLLRVSLDKYFGMHYEIHETLYRGHATELSRTLGSAGNTNFIIVGGDGTIQEAVNGLFINSTIINSEIKVGIVSSGTGQGFARSFGVSRNLTSQLLTIRDGSVRRIDLGRIHYTSANAEHDHIFINEFQAGIGAAVVRSLQCSQKRLGGTLAFGMTTLQKTFTHPNQQMSVMFNNNTISRSVLGIVVANGAFTGGSMNLVPGADLSDNYLDLLIMDAQTLAERIHSFSKIYSGTHLQTARFSSHRVQTLSLSSDDIVHTAADGELLPDLPCTIDILPSALSVFSP